MSDLFFYKTLSAILYLCVALMYFRKVNTSIKGEKKQELEKIRRESGVGNGAASSVAVISLVVICLVWPISVIVGTYIKGQRHDS